MPDYISHRHIFYLIFLVLHCSKYHSLYGKYISSHILRHYHYQCHVSVQDIVPVRQYRYKLQNKIFYLTDQMILHEKNEDPIGVVVLYKKDLTVEIHILDVFSLPTRQNDICCKIKMSIEW